MEWVPLSLVIQFCKDTETGSDIVVFTCDKCTRLDMY